MILEFVVLGTLFMAQSNPDLVVETSLSRNRAGTVVSASLKNQGKTPLRVILDDYYCTIESFLFDAQGRKLEARDRRAAKGMRIEPQKVKAVEIRPGASVEFAAFSLQANWAAASCGDLSWELQNVAGQTLQVEFAYSLEAGRAGRAAKLGADGASIGRWSSKRVAIATTALTAKEIRTVLSDRREVSDPAAIPLLLDVVEKAKDELVREWGAVSLGNLKAAAAAEMLSELLLRDKVREVRIAAACALGSIASVDALDALSEASKKDKDDLVRFRAAEALTKLPEAAAVAHALRSEVLRDDQLLEMAKRHPAEVVLGGARGVLAGGTPEWHVRRGAVDLLAALQGDGLRLTLILRSVRDPDPRVRLSAIRAAAASKSKRAVEPLIRVAGDAESGSEARSLLRDLTGESFGDGDAWLKWWETDGVKRFKVDEERKSAWSIQGKTVSREEYEKFVAGLKKTGTGWYCKETSEGGVTGEDMKDAEGIIYQVRIASDLEGVSHEIRRKD